ncbi:unnamed protein product, partial [marine sediment metagenome]
MPSALYGFDLFQCNNTTFRNNNCSDSSTGVLINNAYDLSFISNDVNDNTFDGFNLDNVFDSVFEDNTVNGNGQDGFD